MADQDEKLLALIRRCKDGDEQACESLCKECARIVRAYLLRRSYFRGKMEAIDDVAQQVFLKLWNGGLKKFRGTSTYEFLGYLKTIATNEASTFLSKTRQETEVSLDQRTGHADEYHPLDIPDGAPGPEKVAIAKQQAESLETHFKRYPSEDREIFVMVTNGNTYKEVGEVLRIPLSTVAFRYSRVRGGLQKKLEENLGKERK